MPDALRMSGEDITKAQFQANEVNSKLKAKKGKLPSELDKDSFLKLLVAELRHQDPTQPMNDREFISQMAQFSSLEQMNNINLSIEKLLLRSQSGEAFSLIGKEIEAVDSGSQQIVRGLVSGVVYRQDGVKVIVGNAEVSLNDIHAVFLPSNYRTEPDNQTAKNNIEAKAKTEEIAAQEKKDVADAYSMNAFNKGSCSHIEPIRN